VPHMRRGASLTLCPIWTGRRMQYVRTQRFSGWGCPVNHDEERCTVGGVLSYAAIRRTRSGAAGAGRCLMARRFVCFSSPARTAGHLLQI